MLLVEDEITVLILAESVVQGLGHSTYSAGSVVQALALLDDPGEIDLLFTDIRLPEGDLGGFEVAEQARRKNPNLKVLYTTGDTITDGMKVMFVAGEAGAGKTALLQTFIDSRTCRSTARCCAG